MKSSKMLTKFSSCLFQIFKLQDVTFRSLLVLYFLKLSNFYGCYRFVVSPLWLTCLETIFKGVMNYLTEFVLFYFILCQFTIVNASIIYLKL